MVPADRLAAWATGAGIGFIALMVTWLVGSRAVGLIWEPPLGPVIALAVAIVAGAVTAIVFGARLSRRVDRPEH
jgi:apolipoprotein N-acyltransferase